MLRILKLEIRNHKVMMVFLLVMIYGVMTSYILHNAQYDELMKIERVFSETRYYLGVLEILFIYMMSKHFMNIECSEVIFSMIQQRKFLYFQLLIMVFMLICVPLFVYYYQLFDDCLMDIVDCFFVLYVLGCMFYMFVVLIKNCDFVLGVLLVMILMFNEFSEYFQMINLFHPMIRCLYVDRSLYVMYSVLILIGSITAINKEKYYIY